MSRKAFVAGWRVLDIPAMSRHAACTASASLAVLLGGAFCLGFSGRAAESAASPAGSDLDLVRRLNNAFVQVADTVTPSVVVVMVRPKVAADAGFDHGGVLEMLPEDLRRKFMDRLERERGAQPVIPEGVFPDQGSGVLIREDGYILTNSHVVENADKIEVRLKDGRRYPAEIRGVDAESDIAVLKVEATGLPAARLGDSGRVRVGEFAIAIGAPFELAYSVTFGHISAKGRQLTGDVVMMDQDFLQTDASINPGNSGGPLVNIEGEVIGINTLIRGLNRGIGFAVPVNLAREVSDQLIRQGRFTRAWLGVNIDNAAARVDPSLAPTAGAAPREGVLVTRVLRDGPSWGSDLEAMDVIVAVDGESVRDVGELKRQVSRKSVGKPLALEVLRGERKLTVSVTPGELPTERLAMARQGRRGGGSGPRTEPPGAGPGHSDNAEAMAGASLGLWIGTLDDEAAGRAGLERSEGVLVMGVVDDSAADRRRIRAGDVITKINRRPVRSPKDFAAALKDADVRKGVPVTVVAGGVRRFEVLKEVAE